MNSRLLSLEVLVLESASRSPRRSSTSEGTLSDKGQGRKGNDKQDTEGQSNSLSDGHSHLLVLFGVAPVVEVERFGLQLDFSLLVVSSIDNVVDEVAVTLFKGRVDGVHVLRHHSVVGHVDVALSTAFKESGTHGDDIVELFVRSLDVISVDTLSVVHLLVTFFVFLELVSSVARDTFVGKVEEGFVVVSVSKNLRQGHSFSEVVDTVFVREDSERDGVVVRSTVRTDVILLSILVYICGALKELVQIALLFLLLLVAVVVV
mmetsp:Transcript_21296/g.50395  ORF Transcript_21296/g.50395 Transcript_21296/m.50395 type:complete len:262 (+) Transcript_21296:199-984(+)